MHDLILGSKKSSVLCVIKNNENFLLLERIKPPHQGMFTPVGGKINPFESPKDAAFRELNEETGLTLKTLKYCGILVETSSIQYNWINFVYCGETEYFQPQYCNEGVLKWINFKDIDKYLIPKTDMYIYKYIINSKIFMFNALYDNNIELISLTEEIENVCYSKTFQKA